MIKFLFHYESPHVDCGFFDTANVPGGRTLFNKGNDQKK
jgi:hypothetical protein